MASTVLDTANEVIERHEYQQVDTMPLHDPEFQQVLQIDVEQPDDTVGNDARSQYSSSEGSSTTSLSPSVFEYTYLNGRRYASDRFQRAGYFLPNDDSEQDRLDFYHHMFLLITGGKLYLAPLQRPQRVLDLGTGTGIWAIDFAEEHRQATVIGVDISPIQPTLVPPNCLFEIDDIEESWTWPENHFDYIHMRSLSGAIQDWDALLRQCYEHLQPGCFLEFQDYGCEGFFHTGHPIKDTGTPLADFVDAIHHVANKVGRPFDIPQNMKKMMQKAGFVDVHEKTAIWPAGDWPKDKQLKHLGRWTKQGILDSLEPFSMLLLTQGGNWSLERVGELCERVRQDLSKDSPNKYYDRAWFVCGRKPEDPAFERNSSS